MVASEHQPAAGEGNHQRQNCDDRRGIGLQVAHPEVVRVDLDQPEGINVVRQNQSIDRARQRGDDSGDRCDRHQGSMDAAAQVCRLMGIPGVGLVVLQGLVERLLIGTWHPRQRRTRP